MTAELQIVLWGVLAFTPLILNIVTKADSDALGFAGLIVLSWLFGRICWLIWSPPEAMQFYPIVDMVMGVVSFAAWKTRRAWWKAALTVVSAVQCALHAAFWLAHELPWNPDVTLWADDYGQAAVLRYVVVNNALFALSLICVAYPGGRSVARGVGDRLPRLLRRIHLAWP